MIKNIFTSPKKTKREKTPEKKAKEPENSKSLESQNNKTNNEKSKNMNGNSNVHEYFSHSGIDDELNFMFIVNYSKTRKSGRA